MISLHLPLAIILMKQEFEKKNYNSKKEYNKEKDQREDERNVILGKAVESKE